MNMGIRAILLVVTLVLCSCVSDTRYHYFLSLPEKGWGRQDTIVFSLPADTETGWGNLMVELRATRRFFYTGMWIGVQQMDSVTNLLHTDTLCISMADSLGWLDGRGQNLLEYTSSSVGLFCDSDKTCRQVRLYHLMSQETIGGLTDIGLRIYGGRAASQ